jgi:murein DD-endopeptidase MepM/ murein hydrolase activator NlpD
MTISTSLLKPRWIAGAWGVVLAFAGVRLTQISPRGEIAPPVAVEPITVQTKVVAHEEIPDKSLATQRDEATYQLPKSIDLDTYPTLRDWVFPIVNASEQMPVNPQRHFGALRGEIHRSDCMRGHCGVDLDGPRGRSIVAVAAGTLVKVERRHDGGDGMSGRFVRIQHDDGTFTTYMHMDRVAAGLELGDHVEQGQFVGVLGSTGVSQNVPHLHFALELPNKNAKRKDITNCHYVNPAAFLVRARLVPFLDRPERPERSRSKS